MSVTTKLLAHWGRVQFNRDLSSLNPQPLPPKVNGVINPQSFDAQEYGAAAARQLLGLAWTADRLGISPSPLASWEDGDLCPVPFIKVPIPPGFPLPPLPDPEPGPDWRRSYLASFAATIAATSGPLGRTEFLAGSLEHALEAFDSIEG